MKIIVFGATGGFGQYVVKQALEKGVVVTAFVRTPSKLELAHDQLYKGIINTRKILSTTNRKFTTPTVSESK
jgi:putative NADH-flavin reductase